MENTAINHDEIIARSLYQLGIRIVFGLVGIPVVKLAEELVKQGIQFVAFRHEASAAYAACAHGYFTATPGVCLVVGGPGVINALTGVYNAKVNNWPMILLAGAMSSHQIGWGAFQELDQSGLLKDAVKYVAQPRQAKQIPQMLEKAYALAIQGRPGPCYVELTEDFLNEKSTTLVTDPLIKSPIPVPVYCQADPRAVDKAVSLLLEARAPLVVIGKGCAYARAESTVLELVNLLQIPFLPTPMGKGVIDDAHHLCVSAARSLALAKADCVLLLGARLNWMLHFGLPPKYDPAVKFIQTNSCAFLLGDELDARAVKIDVGLVGHLPLVLEQIIVQAQSTLKFMTKFEHQERKLYMDSLLKNKKLLPPPISLRLQKPLSYADVYQVLRAHLSSISYVMVTEGANTMDLARPFFDFSQPRRRIDAGTFATMGVGLGYIIAAKLCHPPDQWVVAIMGDSAFGFSAMDLETAVRLGLKKIVIVIMDNHGIYHGLYKEDFDQTSPKNLPATTLSPDTRYDLLAQSLGANGWFCDDFSSLELALQGIWSDKHAKPAIIQVKINPMERKKFVCYI